MAVDDMQKGTVVKSTDVEILIKGKEQYFRQKKTTTLEISVDTETEEKKFIADLTSTVFSKNVKFSLPNDLYTIKGEPDFDFFFDLYVNLPKGMPAPLDILVVYKALGAKSTGYKAWHFPEAQVVFTGYNAVDSVLNYDFNFGQGEVGTCNMNTGTPTFQKGE